MLDEPDEAPYGGLRPSAPDAAQWQALEIHLRAVASAAARWEKVARVERGDEAQLAGLLHDIGKAQTAFQDLVKHRTTPDDAPPASRRFGAFAGKFAVDDNFLDPLPEVELASWNGR